MSWLALFGALAKLAVAAAHWLRDKTLLAAGEARGRALSDAAHARTAAEQGRRMQEIAARPPGRVEIEQRLDEGSA